MASNVAQNTILSVFYFKAVFKILVGVSKNVLPPGLKTNMQGAQIVALLVRITDIVPKIISIDPVNNPKKEEEEFCQVVRSTFATNI